eukprot:1310782-Prymnesium_polylepis.1
MHKSRIATARPQPMPGSMHLEDVFQATDFAIEGPRAEAGVHAVQNTLAAKVAHKVHVRLRRAHGPSRQHWHDWPSAGGEIAGGARLALLAPIVCWRERDVVARGREMSLDQCVHRPSTSAVGSGRGLPCWSTSELPNLGQEAAHVRCAFVTVPRVTARAMQQPPRCEQLGRADVHEPCGPTLSQLAHEHGRRLLPAARQKVVQPQHRGEAEALVRPRLAHIVRGAPSQVSHVRRIQLREMRRRPLNKDAETPWRRLADHLPHVDQGCLPRGCVMVECLVLVARRVRALEEQ